MGCRGRFRLPARLALSAVLAGLAAPVLSSAVQADAVSLSVTAHAGYHDVTKQGDWMPVTLDITNKGGDFQGVVQIEPDTGALNLKGAFGPIGPLQNASYQIPLSLPAGGVKHLRTYALDVIPGMPVTVRLLQNGHQVTAQAVPSSTNASVLIGVLSDQPTAFDEFGALRFPSSLAPQVVHLTREDVPESGILLRAFDLIAIDDFATDSLTAGQRAAVADYVANGGSLLIGSGPTWRKTVASLKPDVVPMQLSGTSVIEASGALGGNAGIEVAIGTLNPGARTWLALGSAPLLVERPVGNGLVTLATFDWAQDPIASWSGSKNLLRQVAVRSFFGSQSLSGGLGIGGGGGFGPYYGGGAGSSILSRSSAMMQPLSNVPALDLPSLKLTGILILLYVLLAGPVNYLVLRVIGRRELAWITVPSIAVLFAVGAYGIGVGTKGRSVQTNQIAIVHVLTGSSHAYQESFTGMYAPTRGDYAVHIPGARVAIVPGVGGYDSSGIPLAGGVRVLPEDNSVDLLGVTAFNLRSFATEGMVSSPALSAQVTFSQGALVGAVLNQSSIRFSDAVFVAGDSFQALGPIAPGQAVALSLQPKAPNPAGGNPVFMRIYPNTLNIGGFNPYPGGPAAKPTEAERRAQDRTLILGSLLGGYQAMVSPAITPVLVAWTDSPLQSITINGSVPRSHTTNAVIVPVSIGLIGAGALPAGLISARLIDFSGEGQPGPGSLFLQSGSATYEFAAPLAAGVHLTGATLSSSNTFYGKPIAPGSTGGQSNLKASVWNWSSGAWMPIDLAGTNSTAVPDAGIDPVSGTIRVKVIADVPANVGPGLLLGNLSLTGTLQ